MKIAILGSRGFEDYKFFKKEVEKLGFEFDQVISGGAVGADTLARKYARENGMMLTEVFPNYKKYHRSAPIRRNETIIKMADFILFFWDFKSPGTKFGIDYAKKSGKEMKVVKV